MNVNVRERTIEQLSVTLDFDEKYRNAIGIVIRVMANILCRAMYVDFVDF